MLPVASYARGRIGRILNTARNGHDFRVLVGIITKVTRMVVYGSCERTSQGLSDPVGEESLEFFFNPLTDGHYPCLSIREYQPA